MKNTFESIPVKSNSGFSLIEALVASGVLALFSLFGLQIMEQQSKTQRILRQNIQSGDVKSDVSQALYYADVCTHNFAGVALRSSTVSVQNIRNLDNTVRYATGGSYHNSAIKVLGIYLENLQIIEKNKGIVHLRMELDRVGSSMPPLNKRVDLRVDLDNPNSKTIVACSAGNAFADSCRALGGEYIAGITSDQSRCIHKQVIVSNDDAVVSSKSPFHYAPSSNPNPNVDKWGIGMPYGDIWFYGGPDGVHGFQNTGDDANGEIVFGWNYDASEAPLPGSGTPTRATLIVKNGAGSVGIGYTEKSGANPVPNTANTNLFVNSDARFDGDMHSERLIASGQVYNSAGAPLPSDVRRKKNIESIQGALSSLKALRGVSHEWRWDESQFSSMNMPRGKDLGVVAQEVEMVIPEAVIQGDDGYKWVHYQKIIPFLVQSFKELVAEVRKDEKRAKDLRARLDRQIAGRKELLKAICPKHPEASVCKPTQ